MDDKILKIRRAYSRSKGPAIKEWSSDIHHNELYWLAAMGMIETLNILGTEFYEQ